MKLSLSPDYTLDTDDYAAEGVRINAMGMSGAGKSNTTAILAEQIIEQGGQVIIIEPVAEWHTLKAHYSNIVVIGGPFQDLPIDVRFIPEYVETALANGINLVVNVSDFETEEEQRNFVSRFLRSLYAREQRHRKPVFLFLEEADMWAPQMYDRFSKSCRDAVRTIAKRGRKVGLFLVLITQRPADIDKTPTSQSSIHILGKFAAPADLDSKTGVMFYAKKLNTNITEKDFMQLKVVKGEYAEFFINDVHGFHKVTVPAEMRKTPHGADTPDIEYAPVQVELAPVLEDLRKKLEEAMAAKDAEESEINKFGKIIEGLERTIARQGEQLKLASDLKSLLQGGEPSDSADVAKKIMEIEKKHEEELQLLKSTWTSPENVKGIEDQLTELEQQLESLDLFKEAITAIIEPIVNELIPKNGPTLTDKQIEKLIERKIDELPVKKRQRIQDPGETGIPWVDLWLPKLKKMERKIVILLAGKIGVPLTKEQIALTLAYSVKGGSFNAAMSSLKKRYKLIIQEGDKYKIAEAST